MESRASIVLALALATALGSVPPLVAVVQVARSSRACTHAAPRMPAHLPPGR